MADAPKKNAGKKKGFGAVIAYFREGREELAKVVWPTKKELYRHTTIVIAISLGVAFFLGFLDILLQNGLEFLV